jgi:LmbE family N-acetylglucosaminyl deacetylase
MICSSRWNPLLFILPASICFAQIPRQQSAAEIELALRKLNVLGSVLFVAAHPDDENTAFLAMMAKGRLYRTAYLSMTRGEGGQNLIGAEQSELMGVIRTQELLAARRIDGAEQFFTRAIDFGYSKTSEETIRFWGREKVLADVVWVIRMFRPDVIVTRFTPTQGTHGNHLASAIFAYEAFGLAGDSTKFPEQLKFVKPWKAKRILWNAFRFGQDQQPTIPPNSVSLDLGTYNPLLGKSYTEIAGESRSMHKSQGFGAAQNRGELVNYFQHVDGDTAKQDLFDGVTTTWGRVAGASSVETIVGEAIRNFDSRNPSAIIPSLFQAYRLIDQTKDEFWRLEKLRELRELILACSGVALDVWSTDFSVTPGGELKGTALAVNRSDYPITLAGISCSPFGVDTVLQSNLRNNVPLRIPISFRIPFTAAISRKFWLEHENSTGTYEISEQQLIGGADNDASFVARFKLQSPDGAIEVDVPARQRMVDPVEGEMFRPVEVVPLVAVNLEERIHVFPEPLGKMVRVTLQAGKDGVAGSLRLRLPAGWTCEPGEQEFRIWRKGEEQVVSFLVKPGSKATSGEFSAEAFVNGSKSTEGIRVISYKHIPTQTVFPKAFGKLLRLDVKRRGQNIGYIMGAGDDIPAALRQIGFSVTLLGDEEIAEGNLAKYDAIVAGVRAYNTRPKLRQQQKRLMDYTSAGGTYLVQYVTPQRGESENISPYPLTISRDRVTEEHARIAFVNPRHPLLNVPNKISEKDFEGWTQERGLYFAGTWDARFDTVIASHDQNEKDLAGGLLVAPFGEGYYIYNAYAFFRQLPAGVEGAYRLLGNMVSLKKNPDLKTREVHTKK